MFWFLLIWVFLTQYSLKIGLMDLMESHWSASHHLFRCAADCPAIALHARIALQHVSLLQRGGSIVSKTWRM